jgi:hypothetical protein
MKTNLKATGILLVVTLLLAVFKAVTGWGWIDVPGILVMVVTVVSAAVLVTRVVYRTVSNLPHRHRIARDYAKSD